MKTQIITIKKTSQKIIIARDPLDLVFLLVLRIATKI